MSRRVHTQLLTNAAAADATGIGYANESDIANVSEFGFYVEFGAGTSTGTVLIETASDRNFTGTWAILDTVVFSAANKSDYTAVKGVVRALRARVSVAVTGGVVNVYMQANVT